MRNRKPLIFLAAYFLVIFFWLLFCFRQVQKACIEAGHTAQNGNGILDVTLWPGAEEFSDRAEQGYPFFGGEEDAVPEAEKKPENETKDVDEQNREEQDMKEDEDTKEENTEKAGVGGTIRVVLLGTGGIYHEKILLEADGETLEITAQSPYFAKTGIIRIRKAEGDEKRLCVASLDRSCGHPSYEGILEIRREDKGLVLINEVGLEDYVKGVLPSEMPLSYPLEALKAQAVCARTYARMKQENMVYPQYDAAVDDSTACQVYGNLETSAQGDLAVEETAGEVLRREDGSYMECYYYSTSCGRSAQISVWHGGETEPLCLQKTQEETDLMNQEFFDYISQKRDGHLEAEEAFYRWEYRCSEADAQEIFQRCEARRKVNEKLVLAKSSEGDSEPEITKKALGSIEDMSIAERQEGGVADCLKISCRNGTLYVWGEYNIRYVLAQGGAVILQDDTEFRTGELLPSAFISLQSICNEKGNMVGYIIVGGGFGHGVGLSQNGAKHMALAGNNYQEILKTYYGE